ncbi:MULTISPECIES: NAD kinase [Neobacillus]|jgi:NAD+ kinase|uniref:NAD kinase n=1 Tax=Neobacillus sedimentimangrovi TaxID=2699460 RepID=A0ABS8QMA3_9BACI|nr:NAD kinase [Neobacillus sedimentimangrovi]AIM15898.1 inorganic polyphosphate kinase [Bacillus sp. X1(2014)]MCD4840237.1 NAD kinase [Neobacillus sedimentimangrovi]
MPERKNVFYYYKQEPEILAKVTPLFEATKRYGFTIVNDYKQANIIASIGDDGTFLQAVRKTGFRDDCLYMGISTNNSLNMYCDFRIEETSNMINAMLNEQLEVRRYPLIEVYVEGQGTFTCLNEFSIRSSIIKTLVIDVFVDQLHFETFRGDGLVVATPTGSTAYNKSVNGAIVDPLLSCMQVSEVASLNNNNYRTLGSSFILGAERKLTLKVVSEDNDYPIMGLDNEALSIKHANKITIQLSNKKLKTLKLKNNSFWEKVKRTFL